MKESLKNCDCKKLTVCTALCPHTVHGQSDERSKSWGWPPT